jgi:predicted DNA-binding protein (UPF0251 family)
MTQNSPGGFIRTAEQAHTDTEALRLRSLGWTYQQIADTMGCSKQAASDRCKRALAAIPSDAVDEHRKIEGERLDFLMKVAMDKVMSGDKGALFAIDRVLAIQERKARLYGLDAPIKQEVLTLDAVTAEIRRLEAELGATGDDDQRAETPTPEGTSVTN